MCTSGDPEFVPRVLDVQKGKLCYIIGTVYMDMPLKPNVLNDLARDVSALPTLAQDAIWNTAYFPIALDTCAAAEGKILLGRR